MAHISEHLGKARKNRKQILAWSTPAFILVAVAIAMQFTNEIDWSTADFIVAGVLLYGSLGAYMMVSKLSKDSTIRAGFGFGISGLLLLLWANGAIGLTDSDADAFYIVVVIFAVLGSFLVRFRPKEMSLIMIFTAISQGLVGVVALIAGIVPPHNPPLEIIRIACIFGAAFVISAALFRKAAIESRDHSAV